MTFRDLNVDMMQHTQLGKAAAHKRRLATLRKQLEVAELKRQLAEEENGMVRSAALPKSRTGSNPCAR